MISKKKRIFKKIFLRKLYKMAKLTTKNKWKANQTNSLAIIGMVTFDAEACIEVADEQVDALIAIYPEFSLIGGDEEEDIKKKADESGEINAPSAPSITPQVEEQDISSSSAATGEDETNTIPEPTQKEEDSNEADPSAQALQVTEVEIREKLATKSLAELKDFAKGYPKELTKDLKNKQSYIDFLVVELLKS